MSNAIARLNGFGQAPWYDNLNRQFIESGELARMISREGLRGSTSNPTIFEKAIGGGTDAYDAQLARCVRDGQSIEDTYWDLMLTDIDKACQTFRPVHEEHHDGFVSVELDPTIARDTQASIAQAKLLHERVGHPNVMTKVPATKEGLPVVEEIIASGKNVNVTLIFSLERYGEVIDAYVRGLERFAEDDGDLSKVHSVASFFVSRVDTETDSRLPEGHELRGKAAIANAKLAYQLFRERFSGEPWQTFENKGANLQRPLWASTSTKNPDYSDTLYVDELVGRNTVSTLNDDSVEALRDHGDPQPDTIEQGVDEAREALDGLADAGVDFDDVTATLEDEGVQKFADSFRSALATIEKQREEVAG